DHHIQLISLWPDGCFRLCRRGFLFFRRLAVRERHFKQINPAQEDIIYRLRRMQDLGADLPKIAVMPQSPQDVLTLLAATLT
ncbi:type I 3-dehydroquinate dehydratase, partial [Klebsiella pneumoniae]|uniref:type I 3-dehydroquinate dehydratase n=1 Tax=Klebsiella pneumoniae TaxID=573 RepID=UPI00214AD64F